MILLFLYRSERHPAIDLRREIRLPDALQGKPGQGVRFINDLEKFDNVTGV